MSSNLVSAAVLAAAAAMSCTPIVSQSAPSAGRIRCSDRMIGVLV
jgi:hypothetical protein